MKKLVKMTGERSIESKLSRLAYELAYDSCRIRSDYNNRYKTLANSIKVISSQLKKLSRNINEIN